MATTWQYWRVYITSDNGGGGIEIGEVQFRLNGVDITTGGSASASSSFFGDNGGRAFDKNQGTSWASDFSNVWPQWLKYDFGSPKKVTSVYWDMNGNWSTNRQPRNFQIQCSLNNTEWVDALVLTNIGWSLNVPQEFTFTPPSHGGRREYTIIG